MFIENFFLEIRAFFFKMKWKNTVQPERPQVTIWRTRISRWVHKATNTHSEYVILTAFPLRQWLHECASMLPYKYIASLVDT